METSMPVRIGSGVMPGSVWGRRAIAGFSHWAWDARHGTGRLYSLSLREPGAGRPRPGEETLVSGFQSRHPCLFPRRPTARATLPARTRTSLCSNNRALLPPGAAIAIRDILSLTLRLRSGPPSAFKFGCPAEFVAVMRRRRKAHFDTALHGLLRV